MFNLLNNSIVKALTVAGITENNQLLQMTETKLLQIKGIGAVYAAAIMVLIKDSVIEVVDTTKIEAIRKLLLGSDRVAQDISKLESFIGRVEYELTAHFVQAFLENTKNDLEISRFLNNMDVQDIHRHAATLSLMLPNYGINTLSAYYREKAKIALAMTILTTYKLLYGHVESKQNFIITKNGTRKFTHVSYTIGNSNITKELKDSLKGVSFQAGLMHKKRTSSKAGIEGMKLPSKFIKLGKGLASLKFGIVTDIDFDTLFDRTLMESKEILSIKAGKFLTKGKTYSDLEKKVLIAEKLEETITRYKVSIGEVVLLIEQQDVLGLALHLSVNYDYRGRIYYDVINMLLNPQSKYGKYIWEAFTPRILIVEDYKWLCFAVMSAISRIAPKNAISLFEKDAEGNIEALRASAKGDYLAEVYAERIITALDCYYDNIPNSTFIFKDYTNGGGIHFASGLTREPKAMSVCNMLDVSTVNDPHSDLMESFNLHTGLTATRDDIKKCVSQGITAGISPNSAIEKIENYFLEEHEHEIEITEQQYKDIVAAVYGKTGALFHEYNKLGNSLYDNTHTKLPFTTRSGFKSASIAYISGQEVKTYYVSSEDLDRTNLHKTSIYRNMPMLYAIKGKYMTPALVGEHATAKDKGWLANVTHGANDAVAIHAIAGAMVESNVAGLLIHDNIGTSGLGQKLVLKVAKENIMLSYNDSPFIDAFEQASAGRNITLDKQMFVLEEADENFVLGDNFLQA